MLNQVIKREYFIYFFFAIVYTLFLVGITTLTGVITINEAEKYISAAEKISNGSTENILKDYIFYSSYIVFLTAIFLLGNTTTVVFVQAILSFLAALCIKKTIDLLYKKSVISYFAMLAYLLCFPVQSWVVTLFSDSFFVSITTFTLFYTIKRTTWKENILWSLLLIILIFARPPGVFLAVPFVLYKLHFTKSISLKTASLLFAFAFCVLMLFTFTVPVESKGYITPIAAGRVIVDSSTYTVEGFNATEKNALKNAYKFLSQKNGISGLLKLYLKKAISFFTLTRPYYSKTHNLIAFLHYLLYLLFLFGSFHLLNTEKKGTVLLFVICIFSLMHLVGITYNEWHYRFTIPIFPFLFIGGAGSIFFLKQIWKRDS
ncbi:hypothetical protein ESA94_05470 [Lacibacter luteus]|uniref:Glycosyltransferase RgtA/B/C/D-like domain-containing protein n=1 Tax=Lacibacter luteus TaxID=2508719 RepID=A0A4V1M833_9BACT|nr:hypothetical protein [Lacibacter luteus]RXK62452.1 hypothetical protein ESA94_05470 [Lacibacter luteus]